MSNKQLDHSFRFKCLELSMTFSAQNNGGKVEDTVTTVECEKLKQPN